MRLGGLVVLAVLWAYHTHYMLRRKFDYGRNMRLCIALGIAQSGAWVGWSWFSAHPGRCGRSLLCKLQQVMLASRNWSADGCNANVNNDNMPNRLNAQFHHGVTALGTHAGSTSTCSSWR